MLVALSLSAAALSGCGGSGASSMEASVPASALDGPSATDSAALESLISAESAAIYAYGVIGAHLTGSEQRRALAALKDHRRHRDAWITAATAAGEPIPPAAIAYDLPFAVSDRVSAMELAVVIETRLASVYRAAGESAARALVKTEKRLATLDSAG